jgi:hypothetical protein
MELMTPEFSFLLPLDVPANGTASRKGVDHRALLFTVIAGRQYGNFVKDSALV